jgi:Cu(I)/Ag(I) efflux system membrane fusion protein
MKAAEKHFYLWVAVLSLAITAVAGAAWHWAGRPASASAQAKHELYQCPMHPQVIQDHPGDCPICHMHLRKVEDAPEIAQKKILKYRNPMDPTIFSDHPMKDSMGMDYIPVYAAGSDEAEMPQHNDGSVAGRAAFNLSAGRQQLLGLRTELVQLRDMKSSLRLAGRLGRDSKVQAELMEIDAGSVKPGMAALLRGPDGQEARASVEEVGQGLDGLSRSFAVELEAESWESWMRPGVYVEVSVERNFGKGLLVSRDSILDNGAQQWAFVNDGQGRFRPVQVSLGRQSEDWIQVTRGLKAGDAVVSSANFLIDSESRFQAALDQF